MFVVKVMIFDTLPDYVANCESGCRCHRLNNLACPESLHMWRWRPICPIWKTVQIHGLVQLCQKQIETGCMFDQLLTRPAAAFLKIWLYWQMSIIPNSRLVGSFTDNHGIGAIRKKSSTNHHTGADYCQHCAINAICQRT